MSEENIVRPLSEFQLSWLRNRFKCEDFPMPHALEIKKIALTGKSDLIMEYLEYGRLETIIVKYSDTLWDIHG